MNVSLNWLKEYVNIKNKITPKEIGELLTLHTVEVEGLKRLGENLNKIIVGKIEKLKAHSNADKLKIAIVSDGYKNFQVVCGGSNLYEGMLVAFAKVGAKVKWHGEGELVELESVKLRGEKSEGMICASSEIGLENLFSASDEREVVDLKGNFKVGENLALVLNLDDIVYDIDNKSMTHRPDLWSHYGIARELAVLMNSDLKQINIDEIKVSDKENKIDVKVEDKKLCPRYMAVAIEGIKIKPSSEKIQKRLIACGMRPINNIVDISNYVMLEIGQPTHAFDADKLGNKIIIKKAKLGDKITTLDGEERKLDDEMLLITDGKAPIAIAGVMGGGNSEIDNNTTSIILESANFNAVSIRKTSQKLSLRTESSQRYEKSLDPNLCELAIKRIITLIKESCPQVKVCSKLVDVKNFKLFNSEIKLDINWLNQKIGVDISKGEIIEILKKLGFEVRGSKVLKVKVPSWRATKDISIPEDLIEEVARIYGYKNIKPQMPLASIRPPEINETREFINKIKDLLASAGMTEVYNYSFVNKEQLQRIGIDSSKHIKLANPLTREHTLLRRSLIPNLLNNIVTNQRNYDEIKLFEIGNVFFSAKEQSPKLGLVYARKESEKEIKQNYKNSNYFKLKGMVDYLFSNFGIEGSYEIKEVGDNEKKNIGIKTNAVFCELDIEDLFIACKKAGIKKYKPKNKFPFVYRDIAFVLDEKILYNDIRNEILAVDKLIKDVELFDLYLGEKLGEGKKNMAFHIAFLDENKTLSGDEVDKVQGKIVITLNKKFGAVLRDF